MKRMVLLGVAVTVLGWAGSAWALYPGYTACKQAQDAKGSKELCVEDPTMKGYFMPQSEAAALKERARQTAKASADTTGRAPSKY